MRKSFLFIAVALCAMFTSCNKDVPTVIEASLDVNKTSVTFSEQQQDPQEIKVTSTYPWELTSPADWFTVTPASGEAGETTVTITLNTTDFSAELSEQIVITSEELTKTINVYLSETPIVETESIKIKAPRRKVVVGESMEFEVTINPEGSTLPGEITWSTSAEEIATIENGVITGVAAGVVSATIVQSAVVGTAVGGVVAGTTNAIMQGVTKGEENISYEELAINTFTGSMTGAVSGGAGSLVPAAASGTTALIAQKACQTVINTTISVGAYLLTSPEQTGYGFATAVFSGFVSGVTFDYPFLKSIAIAVGLEFAGYSDDIIYFFAD